MISNIKKLLELGQIPADSDLTDEQFEEYDRLLNFNRPLSEEEAMQLAGLFSPDCDGLNWALLKAIESASPSKEALTSIAEKCPNKEYAALLRNRAEKG